MKPTMKFWLRALRNAAVLGAIAGLVVYASLQPGLLGIVLFLGLLCLLGGIAIEAL